ncbi:MAG TPA: hypothetical protein VHY48_05800 [Acidobacteriaceae bacterium]|nr:hypothetical protein [Acidobacteriaceae bacterium]
MDPVWIVCLEVLAFIDAAPNEGKLGFINVVLSASDSESAIRRASAMLKEYGWQIIGVENASLADPDHEYQDDLSELIDNVIANPHYVLLSTLHSYKPS